MRNRVFISSLFCVFLSLSDHTHATESLSLQKIREIDFGTNTEDLKGAKKLANGNIRLFFSGRKMTAIDVDQNGLEVNRQILPIGSDFGSWLGKDDNNNDLVTTSYGAFRLISPSQQTLFEIPMGAETSYLRVHTEPGGMKGQVAFKLDRNGVLGVSRFENEKVLDTTFLVGDDILSTETSVAWSINSSSCLVYLSNYADLDQSRTALKFQPLSFQKKCLIRSTTNPSEFLVFHGGGVTKVNDMGTIVAHLNLENVTNNAEKAVSIDDNRFAVYMNDDLVLILNSQSFLIETKIILPVDFRFSEIDHFFEQPFVFAFSDEKFGMILRKKLGPYQWGFFKYHIFNKFGELESTTSHLTLDLENFSHSSTSEIWQDALQFGAGGIGKKGFVTLSNREFLLIDSLGRKHTLFPHFVSKGAGLIDFGQNSSGKNRFLAFAPDSGPIRFHLFEY